MKNSFLWSEQFIASRADDDSAAVVFDNDESGQSFHPELTGRENIPQRLRTAAFFCLHRSGGSSGVKHDMRAGPVGIPVVTVAGTELSPGPGLSFMVAGCAG
jgi:hypothetical protein